MQIWPIKTQLISIDHSLELEVSYLIGDVSEVPYRSSNHTGELRVLSDPIKTRLKQR